MNTRIFLFLAFPVLSAGVAQGGISGVDIIAETYRAWGNVDGVGAYDVQGTSPVAGSIQTTASSASTTFVEASVYTMNPFDACLQGDARAQTNLTFKPLGNELFIAMGGATFEPPFGALAWAELRDLDSGEWLFYVDTIGGPFLHVETYAVLPEHTYELVMYAGATVTCDYDGAQTYLHELSVSGVPAPGACLLVGLGFGLIPWIRRRL